ncbi:MAG: sulfur carrier protein ThiS [Planctomycetes bacterium]|nr:sulfur carrier protein ThiS [Planctomycetota bacterium]
MQVEIRVNGLARSVERGSSVAALVRELGLRPELVAVERNGRIVRRAQHETTALEPGDELELVTMVGGG